MREVNALRAGRFEVVDTHHDGVIFEPFLERLEDRLLTLLLDNAGGRGKDSEGILPLLSFGCLAELEERTKQFWPGITC